MRIILILTGLALLGGCNVVITKTPLFTATDEAGAPPLRPGVWAADVDSSCQVDQSRPLADWPECAGGVVFAPGDAAYHEKDTPKGALTHEPFIFAAGDPRIVQARLKLGGDIKLAGEPTSAAYVYVGAKPTKFDAQGRVVAITAWFVQCGPPNTAASDGNGGTLHPLPGMAMKPGDPTCTTDQAAALRGAAKASEAWAQPLFGSHWVRDGAS